jgi:hypothetical protein
MSKLGPADNPDLDSRRERAAGRILDDERLRGGLTDDEFKPLLDWALDVIDRVVLSTAGEDGDRSNDAIGIARQEILELIRLADIAIQAHREGRHASRREALTAIDRIVDEHYEPNEVGQDEGRPLERLAARLDAEPGLDTVAVAREIVRAISGPTRRRRGDAR